GGSGSERVAVAASDLATSRLLHAVRLAYWTDCKRVKSKPAPTTARGRTLPPPRAWLSVGCGCLGVGDCLAPGGAADVGPVAVRVGGVGAVGVRLALRGRVAVLEAEGYQRSRRRSLEDAPSTHSPLPLSHLD